ncbi:LOW QUALITY PROTEIN: NIF3-like protein 1 [Amphiura filiformis]|uniref:LOW QUALITY PROTEIN: NIF3-like protein 1 n=1 Tax=Amphiura filiformis TaxID=82378 RepID=UPI003B22382D
MDLKNVVKKLNRFAPTTLAEDWDNVGLLVEPTPPHKVNTLFLTNDLTEEVLEEAVTKNADMILAYHPPIFSAMKRLTMRTEKERIIVKAIEKRIAIYSPHTSYDAVDGGVNDWLASGLEIFSKPLQNHVTCGDLKGALLEKSLYLLSYTRGYKLEFLDCEQGLTHTLKSVPGVSDIMLSVNDNMVRMRASMNCTTSGLPRALEILNKDEDVKGTIQITQLMKPPIPHTGMGRLCTLKEPINLKQSLEKKKKHLNLPHVQLAVGKEKSLDSPVKTIAVCAGSGSTVLRGSLADLYVTGEMSHHEVLAAVAQGTSVILCNHSNTERGYLQVIRNKFDEQFEGKVKVIVSEVDEDPLKVF